MRTSAQFMTATSLLAFSIAPAFAQNAAKADVLNDQGAFAEIVVTAQKREQRLLDVPINISVVDQARIDRLGATELERLADFVPGLEVQQQSLNAPSFALRGITSDGGRQRVALFQNGVAIGNLRFGQSYALFDMDRIEVVKGPQATLFGQGALVGGINFIQNRASTTANNGAAIAVEAGDYALKKAEGSGNLALSDTFAVRGAFHFFDRDGYVTNLSNSPDLMGQRTEAARIALRWRPTDALQADLIFNGQRDDSTGTQFKSAVFAPAGGDVSAFTDTAMNINNDQLRSKLGNDRDAFSATAEITYDFSDAWRLTSLTDTRNIQSLEAFDSDGTAFDILQFGLLDKGNAFSQELRLNFDAGGLFSFFLGGNYYNEETSQFLQFSTDEARIQALFAPRIAAGARLSVAQLEGALAAAGVPGASNFDNVENPLRFSALGALQRRLVPLNPSHVEAYANTSNTTSFDLFADATFKVTDRLSLTAGVRSTKEEIAATAIGRLVRGNPALGGTANGVFFNQLILSALSPNVLRRRSEDLDSALTWRWNGSYQVRDDLNIWLAYGRGRRPEGLSASASSPSGFALVEEEIYDHVEAGLSGYFFDRSLRTTTSVYYGEYADFQTSRFSPNLGTFILENSGNATQYGFEIEGEWIANDRIEVFGTYAFNFSEYDDKDDDGNAQLLAGNKFRLSPEHNISVGANLRFPLIGLAEFFFVPSYTWKSEHFFEDDNDAGDFQDSYGVLDLRAGIESLDKGWKLNLVVKNALDEEYLIDAGNTGGAFGIPTLIRGAPRIFSAGVSARF
jgi:outer membrane receptor protein involved in Fe transport